MSLPRYYATEPSKEREVAVYLDGKYLARGPASEGEDAARYGWRGYNERVSKDRQMWELDHNAGGSDRPNLCWGNAKLTNEEFLAWLRETD